MTPFARCSCLFLATLLLSLVAACAPVRQAPVAFTPAAADAGIKPQRLAADVMITPDDAYRRLIRAGSQWLRVGSTVHGDVYKPYQDVFSLEGAHVHEAYLVVDKGTLVGFYLPAERTFSSLQRKTPISIE